MSNYRDVTAEYCCIAHVDQGLMHWKLQRDALPVIISGEIAASTKTTNETPVLTRV